MNTDLESLIRSLDSLLNARPGPEAEQWEALFDSQVEDVLRRYPGLSRGTFLNSIYRAHNRWLKAQERFPTLPPQA